MTLKELSKLYYLTKLIDRNNMRLAELEARLSPGGMNMSGMPRNPNPKNMIEEVVPQIDKVKEQIKRELLQLEAERKAIEDYIHTIDDYQMQLILSYRFVDLMTWNEIASAIGGRNTENSVKKACYRFLKKSEQK